MSNSRGALAEWIYLAALFLLFLFALSCQRFASHCYPFVLWLFWGARLVFVIIYHAPPRTTTTNTTTATASTTTPGPTTTTSTTTATTATPTTHLPRPRHSIFVLGHFAGRKQPEPGLGDLAARGRYGTRGPLEPGGRATAATFATSRDLGAAGEAPPSAAPSGRCSVGPPDADC